jgi:hypothetical protein
MTLLGEATPAPPWLQPVQGSQRTAEREILCVSAHQSCKAATAPAHAPLFIFLSNCERSSGGVQRRRRRAATLCKRQIFKRQD